MMNIKPINTTVNNQNYKNHQSFKGLPGGMSVTENLAYGLGSLASKKPVQKLIDFLKDKNYQRHIPAAVSILLSSFYMKDTAFSKKIEKDQKLPLILNQGFVLALSTAGAYTINEYIDKKLDKFGTQYAIANIEDKKVQKAFIRYMNDPEYLQVLQRSPKMQDVFVKLQNEFEYSNGITKAIKKEFKNNPSDETLKNTLDEILNISKNELDKFSKAKQIFMKNLAKSKALQKIYNKIAQKNVLSMVSNVDKNLAEQLQGFKVAKSLMIFGLMYRFFSPVIAPQFANRISKYFEDKKKAVITDKR